MPQGYNLVGEFLEYRVHAAAPRTMEKVQLAFRRRAAGLDQFHQRAKEDALVAAVLVEARAPGQAVGGDLDRAAREVEDGASAEWQLERPPRHTGAKRMDIGQAEDLEHEQRRTQRG